MSIAEVVDVVWTVIAIVGIAVSGWALADGFGDLLAVRRKGVNGEMRVVVRITLRGAGASLFLHSFFLALGYLAVTTTAQPHPSPFYFLLAGGYIAVAATNVTAVGLNQFERVRLRAGKLPS